MRKSVFLFLLSAFPHAFTAACSMCGGLQDQQKIVGYYWMTLVLLAVPLLSGGLLFWWVWKRYK